MLLSIMNSRKKKRGQTSNPRNFRNDVVRRMETAGRSVDLPEVWKTQVGRWKCRPSGKPATPNVHGGTPPEPQSHGLGVVDGWKMMAHFTAQKFIRDFWRVPGRQFVQGYLQLHLNRLMHSKMCSCQKMNEQMNRWEHHPPYNPDHEATMSWYKPPSPNGTHHPCLLRQDRT